MRIHRAIPALGMSITRRRLETRKEERVQGKLIRERVALLRGLRCRRSWWAKAVRRSWISWRQVWRRKMMWAQRVACVRDLWEGASTLKVRLAKSWQPSINKVLNKVIIQRRWRSVKDQQSRELSWRWRRYMKRDRSRKTKQSLQWSARSKRNHRAPQEILIDQTILREMQAKRNRHLTNYCLYKQLKARQWPHTGMMSTPVY